MIRYDKKLNQEIYQTVYAFNKKVRSLNKNNPNIIKKLESNDVSLEESIELFEKGIKLSELCRKTLDTAQNKIITLTNAESDDIDD